MPNFFPTSVEFMETISLATPQMLPMFCLLACLLGSIFLMDDNVYWLASRDFLPQFRGISTHARAKRSSLPYPFFQFPLQVKPDLIPGVGLSETLMPSFLVMSTPKSNLDSRTIESAFHPMSFPMQQIDLMAAWFAFPGQKHSLKLYFLKVFFGSFYCTSLSIFLHLEVKNGTFRPLGSSAKIVAGFIIEICRVVLHKYYCMILPTGI